MSETYRIQREDRQTGERTLIGSRTFNHSGVAQATARQLQQVAPQFVYRVVNSNALVLSEGHVETVGDFEFFFHQDGNLYRAPISNPLDVNGYRMGGRFECYPHLTDMALKLARLHG